MSQVVLSGCVVGAAYVLTALGFAIQYEVADIVNIAHGAFVVGAMYVTLIMANAGISIYLAVPAAVVAWAALSAIIYLALMGPARLQRGHRVQVVYSILLLSGLTTVYELVFGADAQTVHHTFPNVYVAGATLTMPQAVSVSIAIVLAVGLYLTATRTRIGKTAYVAGRYATGAKSVGISVERVYLWMFVIGGSLAGLAGGLVVTFQPVDPTQGLEFTLIAALVAIVARTHLIGCLLLGLAYGVVQELVSYYVSSQYAYALSLCLFVVILIAQGYNPRGWLRRLKRAVETPSSGVT